jgi:N-acetyl-anhydromuramyl-L-alanine amidase AmpD
MQGVQRITVHHEGWTPVYFTDKASTAKRLEQIRRSHVERGWADIGYHYVIDRAGRVWEGRNISYQGAHVRDQNEHNLGIMVLGNFDLQRPSDAQLTALAQTLRTLTRYYNIPISRVYTHQELNSTTCPGRNLQPRMVAIRRAGFN